MRAKQGNWPHNGRNSAASPHHVLVALLVEIQGHEQVLLCHAVGPAAVQKLADCLQLQRGREGDERHSMPCGVQRMLLGRLSYLLERLGTWRFVLGWNKARLEPVQQPAQERFSDRNYYGESKCSASHLQRWEPSLRPSKKSVPPTCSPVTFSIHALACCSASLL